MTHHPANLYRALLEAKLRRAEERLENAGSDIEREGNRQIIIWLKSELEGLAKEAA
jgi:hypothetical protein